MTFHFCFYMRRFQQLFFAFFFFVSAFEIKAQTACTSLPVGPDESNLPSYFKSSMTSIAEDSAGNIFVASLDIANLNTPVVHRYNGTKWEKLTTTTLTGCSRIDLAVSKSGKPYIALRDPNMNLSVLSYSAGNWSYVGSAGFSSVTVWTFDIQLDKQENPVVAFEDQVNSRGSVMKFNGTTWNFVGTQFISNNYAGYLSLAIDTGNVCYVGYQDGATFPARATVRKLASNTWSVVGLQSFSSGEASYMSLKFSRTNNLYIAYSDYFYSQRVTVKTLSSGTWTNVGSPGFTLGQSDDVSLAIDSSGVLSVAANVYNGAIRRGNMMRYVGTTWTNVGSWALSEKEAQFMSHMITRNNQPIVAYVDQNRHNKTAVKLFNGSTWQFIGERGFSGGACNNGAHFAVAPNGALYACFSDSLNGDKASVMTFSNGAWSYVGPAGITAAAAKYIRIAVDGSNMPYIAYSDYSNGMKLAVMRYNGTVWQSLGTAPLTTSDINLCEIAVFNGTAHVVATNTTTGFRDVLKYNGSSWTSIYASWSNVQNRAIRMQFDNSGNLYIHSDNSGSPYFSRYDGSAWTTTLGAMSSGNYPDLAFDPIADKMYVAYSTTPSYSIGLRRWDSPIGNWTYLPSNTAPTYTSYGNSMVVLNGVVYLATIDGGGSKKAKLMRFDGNAWANVATLPWLSSGQAADVSLQAKGNDTLLLFYRSTETYVRKIALGSISVNTVAPNCAGVTATFVASGATTYSWNTGGTGPTLVVTPTLTTGYHVSTTLANGCIASACRVVSVMPTPTVSITSNPASATLCVGNVANVFANGANSYTWSTGSTNTMLIVPVTTNTLLTLSGTGTLNACTNTAAITLSAVPYPTITIAASQNSVCPGDQVVLTPSGASNYNLVNTSASGGPFTVNPLSTTMYTITGYTGCSSTETVLISVFPTAGPVIAASSPSVCLGSQVTLSLTGASTYTWVGLTPPSSSTVMPVSPGVMPATDYSVQVTNSFGCSSTQSISIAVIALPSLSATASPTAVCSGNSVLFSGQGASTYSWSQGVVNNVPFTPVATSVYTVIGQSAAGCTSTATLALAVLPLPTVTATSNTSTICSGTSATLTAGGASTYSWTNSTVGASTTISPLASTCYTVLGTDLSGCNNSATVCIQVLTATLSVSSASVCLGTSHTFSASGLQTYTWSNQTNASTLNVLPLVTTSYSVSGVGANGCFTTSAVTLSVNPLCSDVWPGDANSDGVVNSSDVFEIGWANSASGPARASVNINYVAQYAANWTGTVSTGKNLNHADCNGDGVVSLADTLAISSNFSQTHAFKPAPTGPQLIRFVADTVIGTGVFRQIDIVLADSLNEIDVYGLAFDIDLDANLIEASYLEYTPSFLNTLGQNIEFKKYDANSSRIHAVSVRTDKSNVKGYGRIARLHFKIKDEAVGQEVLFGIANGKIANADHSVNDVANSSVNVDVVFDQVGIKEQSLLLDLKVSPNPANQELKLYCPYRSSANYVIYDVSGRRITSGSFESFAILQTASFSSGLYFIQVTSGGKSATIKVVIQH